MNGFERHQLLAALMLLVMALFVSANYPPAYRWRRQLRIASIVLFAAAAILALVEIAIWLGSGGR